MRHGDTTTLGWKEVITALIAQTVIAGMAFYAATVRWQAQIEERITWMQKAADQNLLDHRTILLSLEELKKDFRRDR